MLGNFIMISLKSLFNIYQGGLLKMSRHFLALYA